MRPRFTCGAAWAICGVLAVSTAEAVDARLADVGGATSGSTVGSRVIDLVRFVTIVCDDQPVAVPLVPERNICAISAHLTPEGIELLRRQLTDPNALALLRRASPQVAQLLPIMAAAAPLLDDIKPQVQFVMARQEIDKLPTSEPWPALPAVAIVFEPNDVRRSKSLLLATYWAVIKGANELAERDGTSRLGMRSGKRGEAFLAQAYFRDPPKTDALEEQFRYNLTPAIGATDSRCIISSSGALCGELLDLAQAQPPQTELARGPRINIGMSSAAGLVMDNLRVAAPRGTQLAGISQGHLDEVSKALADALRRVPDRTRPVANLLERIRERRLCRLGDNAEGL
jgi:hypothetical protein